MRAHRNRLGEHALIQPFRQPKTGSTGGSLARLASSARDLDGPSGDGPPRVRACPRSTASRRSAGSSDPLMIGEKKDEEHIAGLVFDKYFIGCLAPRPRRMMRHDVGLDRHDLIERRIRDLRPVAAIDGRYRQMKQEIDGARRTAVGEEPVEQLADFRPHARQAGGRRKQRIEQGWADIVANYFFARPII